MTCDLVLSFHSLFDMNEPEPGTLELIKAADALLCIDVMSRDTEVIFGEEYLSQHSSEYAGLNILVIELDMGGTRTAFCEFECVLACAADAKGMFK